MTNLPRVKQVTAKPDFTLAILFDDGVKGEVCLRERLFGPVFSPLRDAELFAQVSVDEFGAICWPNNADLAPDALYLQITGHDDALLTVGTD